MREFNRRLLVHKDTIQTFVRVILPEDHAYVQYSIEFISEDYDRLIGQEIEPRIIFKIDSPSYRDEILYRVDMP